MPAFKGVRLINGTPGGSVSTQAAKGALGAYEATGPAIVWSAVGPGQAIGGPVAWAMGVARREGAGGLISPELVITITSEKQSGKSCPIAVAPTQGTGLSAPTQGARIYE